MKDFTLPIMLLTETAGHCNAHQGGGGDYGQSVSSLTNHEQQVLNIFTIFVNVLTLLDGFPEGLAKVLLPVFERYETIQ